MRANSPTISHGNTRTTGTSTRGMDEEMEEPTVVYPPPHANMREFVDWYNAGMPETQQPSPGSSPEFTIPDLGPQND